MDNPLFWVFFEPTISLIENILLVSFVYGCCRPHYPHSLKNTFSYLGIVLVGFAFSFIENMDPFSSFEFLITILLLLLYSTFFLNGVFVKKVAICVIARVLTMISNSLVVFLFSVFLHEDASNFVRQADSTRVIVVLMTKIVYFFLSRLLVTFFQHESNLQKWQWLSIGLGLLISTVSGTVSISIIRTYSFGNQMFRLQMFLIVVGIWLLCVLFYILLNRMSKDNNIRMELALLRQNDFSQLTQIQQMRDSSERIRTIKHDMKNYLAIVKHLIIEKKYEEALQKCEAVTGIVDQVQAQITTGNDSVDAIMNEKISLCRQRKIDTKCSVFCTTKNVPEMPFCSVFGNLMDNAIEAELGLPIEKRIVTIELFNQFGFTYLRISNAIIDSVLQSNPLFQSTKDDKERHGLGHKSIERIMRELGGRVRYYEEEGMFTAEGVFPILQ